MTDEELLQRYILEGSQPAFTELVARHLGLVYSVARRHLGTSASAEDVAQCVFVELARHAARIEPSTPLVAWLHVVSRRMAIDAIRRDARRRLREEQAAALDTATPSAMPSPPAPWSDVEPLLDEAVDTLAPLDRAAILLRFFENKSLRDVGAALGTSDHAAQKRVTRAVEQLRSFFARRGIAVTAGGLAADLSAHGIGAIPAALGAAVHAAALVSPAAAIVGTAQTLAMTTLQKSLLATGIVAFATVGAYHFQVRASTAAQLDQLAQNSAASDDELRRRNAEHNRLEARLLEIEREIDGRLAAGGRPAPDDALESQMRQWLGQIERVKAAFARNPQWSIPELELLGDDQWFNIVSQARIDTDDALRRTMATLRQRAENTAVQAISTALQRYVQASDGSLPPDTLALAPFTDPALEPKVLGRYEVIQRGQLADIQGAERTRIIVSKAPADLELDSFWWIGGAGGFGNTSAFTENLSAARRAFAQLYPDQKPTTAVQLAPHLKWPIDPVHLQQLMDGAAKR